MEAAIFLQQPDWTSQCCFAFHYYNAIKGEHRSDMLRPCSVLTYFGKRNVIR